MTWWLHSFPLVQVHWNGVSRPAVFHSPGIDVVASRVWFSTGVKGPARNLSCNDIYKIQTLFSNAKISTDHGSTAILAV